jgi:hypothetical protein
VNEFNMKWGVGDKEESFVEQGHQIGLRDNRHYAGFTNFIQRTESTMKERCNATHPLVLQQQQWVVQQMKCTKSDHTEKVQPAKRSKLEHTKHEKEATREFYISKCKEDE